MRDTTARSPTSSRRIFPLPTPRTDWERSGRPTRRRVQRPGPSPRQSASSRPERQRTAHPFERHGGCRSAHTRPEETAPSEPRDHGRSTPTSGTAHAPNQSCHWCFRRRGHGHAADTSEGPDARHDGRSISPTPRPSAKCPASRADIRVTIRHADTPCVGNDILFRAPRCLAPIDKLPLLLPSAAGFGKRRQRILILSIRIFHLTLPSSDCLQGFQGFLKRPSRKRG